jgi:hypothetical protein
MAEILMVQRASRPVFPEGCGKVQVSAVPATTDVGHRSHFCIRLRTLLTWSSRWCAVAMERATVVLPLHGNCMATRGTALVSLVRASLAENNLG